MWVLPTGYSSLRDVPVGENILIQKFYCHWAVTFPLFLNNVIPEVLSPLLLGSALARGWSLLETTGNGSLGHGGSFWHLLTEAMSVAPYYQNLAT